MDNAQVAGLTVTAMVAAADMFGKVLPAPHELVDRPATAANLARTRAGCMKAAPLVVGLGVGASLLARSPWPFLGVAAVTAWMWWQYDQAAKHDAGPAVEGPPAVRGRYA